MDAKRCMALVVDDNENNLTLEKDLLEVAGFEVVGATDAFSAIAIARRELPDIIIMDVRLPDMRGTDAARILRKDATTRAIPIVFVTASVMAEGKEEIKAMHNTGFIGKPINTRTFAQEVRQCMAKPKPLILLVDDQPQNIDLLEARLAPEGYGVVKAACGEEALEKLAGNLVDLMLLDVMMPGMDGFEVTRRVRSDSFNRGLPIILLTALTETEHRVKGIEAGCDDFISKPVDKMELLARVRSLLKVKAYNDLMESYRKDLESEVSSRTADLKRAMEDIKAASLETIYRLSVAAEFKDRETGAHIRRMSRYSAAVAKRMGLDDATVETILHAAPMHDVGKIGIPDSVLLKPGRLDADEWEIMKQHTLIGASILRGSDADVIRMGESIAHSHHERWDGAGYPDGLKGEEIPLTSRVAAIADVFDALTSRRPYKEPFGMEESIGMIKGGRGSHFDPDVVDAFMAVSAELFQIRMECTEPVPSKTATAGPNGVTRQSGHPATM